MVALITMVALIAAYLLANVLSRTSAEVRLDNDQRTRQALLEAKAALIVYAASQALNDDTNNQPGALPCPSLNENGNADMSCGASASSRIGRLPWKKIGASDLRDGSGALLWYALSANFRKSTGNVINSDTQGTLTIAGATPASNVVAVVIAPGMALSGQTRSTTSEVSTYLESGNAANTDTFFTATKNSETFNDQVMPITQADLMAVLEPAVAARIERDIKPYLSAQLQSSDWGRLPFPARFNDSNNVGPGTSASRAQDLYLGSTAAASGGLLPLTSSVNSWSNGEIDKVSGTGNVSNVSCDTVSGVDYRCTFTISGSGMFTTISNLRVQMKANADRAGLGFSFKPDVSSVSTTVGGATNVFISPMFTVSALNNDGSATLTYVGTINVSCNFCSSRTVRITFADLVTKPVISSSDTYAGWFIKNQWYRQTYYAVAPGYLPGGSGSCAAGTDCLTVSNLPASYATPNDKRAILVFMGRSLNGASRPSNILANYLEGENTTPADRIFANYKSISTLISGAVVSVNDRAVVLAP